MRPLAIAGVVSLSLLVWVPKAAGQEPAPVVMPAADAVEPDSLRTPAAEVSMSGPRLPGRVPSVSLPLAPVPAAPKGNLVIPVTTALIVLAALVLILLID